MSIATHVDLHSLHDQSDNLSHIINAALETYYLYVSQLSSTWIESLYGLVRIAPTHPHHQLSPIQKGVSFAYVCIMPKLITYLKSLKERYRNESGGEILPSNDWKRVAFKYAILFLSGLGDMIAITDTTLVMLFRLLYIANLSPYHHPLFALLKMKMMKKRHIQSTEPQAPSTSASNWTMSAIIMIIYAIKAAEFFTNNDLSEFYITSKLATPTPLLSAPPPPKV
ncbi:hypothetical protein EON65_25340, partial [archaeon]